MNMLLNIQRAYLRPHCGGAGPFSLGRFSNRMIGGASGIQSHLSDPTYHQSASFSGNADFLDLLIDPSIYMSFIAMLDLQSSYLRAPVFRNNKRRALKLSDSVAYSGLSLKLLFTADQYGCRFIQQITHVFGNNITQKIMQGRISPRDVSDFLECKVQNVKPAHEVVNIFFFYWRCRWAEAYTTSLKASCGASGVFVHSSGDGKQEKETPVWADQVLATDHYSWDIDRNA